MVIVVGVCLPDKPSMAYLHPSQHLMCVLSRTQTVDCDLFYIHPPPPRMKKGRGDQLTKR